MNKSLLALIISMVVCSPLLAESPAGYHAPVEEQQAEQPAEQPVAE